MTRTELGAFDCGLLHDAVLVSVSIDWEFGLAEIVLKLPAPPPRRLAIQAQGLRMLTCPREQPWGRSVHVNDAEAPTPDASTPTVLRLQMQSGDTIELTAERILMEISSLKTPSAE